MSQLAISIRDARIDDMSWITAIYRHAVLHTTGTFEIDPPEEADMAARFTRITASGYPFLVAIENEEILGYAYASFFRERPAFRFLVEDSIYVRPDRHGQGIAAALLETLLKACETRGFRQIVAVIGDSANLGSIKVHAKFGFEHAGTLRCVGWKAGRWLDTVMMQRAIGYGATMPAPRDR